MPVQDDHPLRRLRVRAGLSQQRLADLAHVTRNTVAAMEEGRVRRPNPAIVSALAQVTSTPLDELEKEVTSWASTPISQRLSLRAANTLSLPPLVVSRYSSIKQWRSDVASTTTAFASVLRLPRSTVLKWERGEVAMPKSIERQLHAILGLSDEYITELKRLQ